MTSIRRAVEKEKQVIGFLQGHGELKFQETQRARALISPLFSALTDVEINGKLDALKDVDGLIIAGPETPFSPEDYT